MKFLVRSLVTLALAFAAALATSMPAQAIVGGSMSPAPGYPFMVSVQWKSDGAHFCGGTLIRPTWVVTAAHCLTGKRAQDVKVRIGTNDRYVGGHERFAAQLIPHRYYNANPNDGISSNDIALIRLDREAPGAVPIGGSPPEGTPVRMLGWGHVCPAGNTTSGCVIDGQNRYPYFLRELGTSIRPDGTCAGMNKFHPQTELCVDNPGDQGACTGDSGGPVVVWANNRWYVVGATSRIPRFLGCGTVPSTYTDLAWHNQWIVSHTG